MSKTHLKIRQEVIHVKNPPKNQKEVIHVKNPPTLLLFPFQNHFQTTLLVIVFPLVVALLR